MYYAPNCNNQCWLCIPKNEQGINDNEYGYDTENVLTIAFPPNEVEYFFSSGLSNVLNNNLQLIFDTYEEEIIPNSLLPSAKIQIEQHKEKMPTLYFAICKAIHYNTLLELIL